MLRGVDAIDGGLHFDGPEYKYSKGSDIVRCHYLEHCTVHVLPSMTEGLHLIMWMLWWEVEISICCRSFTM